MKFSSLYEATKKELTRDQKMNLLLLAGGAALMGLGWDKEEVSQWLSDFTVHAPFEEKRRSHIQTMLGYICNKVRKTPRNLQTI